MVDDTYRVGFKIALALVLLVVRAPCVLGNIAKTFNKKTVIKVVLPVPGVPWTTWMLESFGRISSSAVLCSGEHLSFNVSGSLR